GSDQGCGTVSLRRPPSQAGADPRCASWRDGGMVPSYRQGQFILIQAVESCRCYSIPTPDSDTSFYSLDWWRWPTTSIESRPSRGMSGLRDPWDQPLSVCSTCRSFSAF